MRCKHCGHVTKYKTRQENGGQCESCKHKFAFEPKNSQHQIGDPLFDRAIQNVSSENTLFFTPRQLWYEVERIDEGYCVGELWKHCDHSLCACFGCSNNGSGIHPESQEPFLTGTHIGLLNVINNELSKWNSGISRRVLCYQRAAIQKRIGSFNKTATGACIGSSNAILPETPEY